MPADAYTAGGSRPLPLDPAQTPASIEARSFSIIDAAVGEVKPFFGKAWSVARRLVHTSGDLTLLDSLYLPLPGVGSGIEALKAGATVFTDTEMVRAGIPMRRLAPLGVTVRCMLSQPGIEERAAEQGMTRSRAAVEALAHEFSGAILAIGNAPTALLALLDMIAAGARPPALVIGMPVGFVNAEESKELLIHSGIPCLALRGRRGGSPLAAATVNALACLAS